jgi:hypothetical protein
MRQRRGVTVRELTSLLLRCRRGRYEPGVHGLKE